MGMKLRAEMGYEQRIEEVKKLAGLIMHKHYCQHDADTVEEFMEVTGGSAVGTVYPPDLPKALAD